MNLQREQTRKWQSSRFDKQEEEPLGPLANLIDLMLVFACGLIAALISLNKNIETHFESSTDKPRQTEQVVKKGRELPQLPSQGESGGNGYESIGEVYRDPKTGKLILIGK